MSSFRAILGTCLLLAAGGAHCVFAGEKDEAKVLLTHSTRPGNDIRLDVPIAFLSPQSARDLKNGVLNARWLYLVLRYSPEVATSLEPPSPEELRQRNDAVVHLFLDPATRPHQKDLGRWYRDRALKDIERDGTASIPWVRAGDGVLRHSDGRETGIEYLVYERGSGKLLFVKCYLAVCSAHRTFNHQIVMKYRFERSRARALRDLDAHIERFLTGLLRQT